ncbi:unnamed protein product [Heligmosomoides polygyrus]|uniref:Smr domain-containing protein n=1 Tax=Heligmosomoides polygyrus TaxID=6339 RepID=A0A183G2B3_HELPZ|nr:unnamed protein product [Heligmosomoides polygyrus]
MSPDIVYTLCPYLDLASMFSLAAAYPIWSNMVHKYVKKLEVELMLLRNKQWELISKSIWKEVPSGVLDVDAINVFQSEISRFEWIVYTGNMHTLFNDLVEALETEKAIIRYKGIGHSPDSAWLVSALEGYLAAKPHQVRCVRRDATEYEIEVGHSL